MSNKENIIIGFIQEIQECTLDDYLYIKLIMLACNSGKPAVVNFLQTAFALIESKQPPLIEMKDAVQI